MGQQKALPELINLYKGGDTSTYLRMPPKADGCGLPIKPPTGVEAIAPDATFTVQVPSPWDSNRKNVSMSICSIYG